MQERVNWNFSETFAAVKARISSPFHTKATLEHSDMIGHARTRQ